MTDPVDDVLAFVTPQAMWWGRSPTRTAMLAGIATQNMTFWGWDRDQWLRVLRATQANIRQVVTAVGYLLCDHRDLHHDLPGFKLGLFARRVFGSEAVDAAVGRVQSHLDELGSSALLRRPNLQHALYRLMVAAGSAQLERCAQPELLVQMRERERNNARRHGIEQLARTLSDLGVLTTVPFTTQPSREEWLDRSRAVEIDVPAEWLGWVGQDGLRAPRSRAVAHDDGSDQVHGLTRWDLPQARKLAACGKIPSHGGRSKIFFRPEIDQALLSSAGLTEDARRLRSVR